MRINLRSVFVDDQDKALRFYTEVLGVSRDFDTSRRHEEKYGVWR